MFTSFQKILVLCCISFTLCLFCIQPGHHWGGDYAMYIAQAQSLIQGNLSELAKINQFAMEQSDEAIGPVLYPMGYPVMLTPVYYLFGLNFVAFKIFTALFFVGSIPLVFTLLRSVSPKKNVAFYATILFALNYQLIYMSDRLSSDFPAMFLSFLALYLMLKSRENNSWLNAFLIGITIFICYATRVAGLVLIPSLAIFHFSEYLKTKNIYLLKVAFPYVVFLCCYLLYGEFFSSFDSKYLGMLENISFQSIVGNILIYGGYLIDFLISTKFFPRFVMILSALIFFPIFAIGIKDIIRRDNLYLLAYCAATLVLYMVYPYTAIRFILPLSAFVIYAILNGLSNLNIIYFPDLNLIKWIASILIIGGILQSLTVIYIQQKKGTNDSLSPEMQSIYAYINEEISDDKIFMFHKPRVLRLFTDNNAFHLNDVSSPSVNQADHLLVMKDGTDYTGFEIQKVWENFQLMKKIE